MPINSKGKWDIHTARGEIISLKIRGNKTTGFGWYLENRDALEKNIIDPLNLDESKSTQDYMVDENPDHLMGIGGYFHFDFKIMDNAEKKTVELIFSNKRPWEDKQPMTLVHVNVIIGEKTEL